MPMLVDKKDYLKMNEEDCIEGEWYWVHIVFYGLSHTYRGIEVARYEGYPTWFVCGNETRLRFVPSIVPTEYRAIMNRTVIDKIISHIERPKE